MVAGRERSLMDERIMQFRVGVIVFATLIITVILVLLFGEMPSTPYGSYTIYVRFSQAPGVTKDTPIRKSGVLIGRVSEVELLDEGGVLVTARIDKRRRLFQNEFCRINSSLLGDAALQVFLDSDTLGPPLGDGATVRGVSAPDPIASLAVMQSNVTDALNAVSQTSVDIRRVAQQVGGILEKNDARISSILQQMDESLTLMKTTMTNANVAIGSANEILGDESIRQQLKRSVESLPTLLSDTNDAVKQMKQTIVRVDENLENITGFTGELRERGPGIIRQLDHTIENVDTLITQFGQRLNNPEGTLGQLLNNRELYDNVSHAAGRIEELTQELRPILRDARVFTDKIARHPETLGVRGALERKPGIK